jgi:Gas vesicle synthesis protein GvpL/GvpF
MGETNVPDALRRALRELAAEAVPGVIERARVRATARAERLIEDVLVRELLAAAESEHRAGASAVEAGGHATSEPPVGRLFWTYCVLRTPDVPRAVNGLEGIEPGSSVETVCDGDLAALISPVPLAEYGDQRLREHLEDLAWVERTARRHENVLEAALGEATIVPLRLCTLFRDRDGVRRLLREHRGALVEGLADVEGCVEWGVKLFADPRAAEAAAPPPDASEGRGATYLLRRQRERALAEKASEVRARSAEVIHHRVGALARASAANPPQRPEVHGREQTMLLNGVYLIDRGRTAELRDTVEGLQEEWSTLGFAIELTGPWPPYNFVSGAAGVLS